MPPSARHARLGLLVGLALSAAGLIAVAAFFPRDRQAADDDGLIRWLEERSMLRGADRAARGVSGSGVQWRHEYGKPRPRDAVRLASVWLLDYPGSVIPRPGESVLATWGSAELWSALRDLGIDLLHTGPVNRAGGVEGREYTPTIDGWFDRISLEIDPAIGSEREYERMVSVAAQRGGSIAGDLVPLHTGPGPDFYLALRAYKDYPGMYTMVEIAKGDWPLLPEVKGPWGLARIPKESAKKLTEKGYLPGLINSNDADEDARNWSGWSASGEVRGADGQVRRWAYLHYFKPAQPALNWLDPSFAGPRALAGDIVRTVHERKTKVVRLDAVPFLGIEPLRGKPGETLHFQHPLSVSATNYLAFLTRKLGGYSFHELNVPLERLKEFTRDGPDLSYDFFTRAQCLHALLTGDAGPLRLSFRWLIEVGVAPVSLVHDLQNHDEITYQLVEPEHRKDETLVVGGEKVTGKHLRDRMLEEMRRGVAGEKAPYNKLYRPDRDGIATTFAGFVAPALGVKDPYKAGPKEVELIRKGHLALAAVNALQPGVFSLSSWDLVGALPVPEGEVRRHTRGGDWRWVNRGGVDLMGASPEAKASAFGLPRAKALYGPVPDQLRDPESFCSRLKAMLAARRRAGLAEGELIEAPEPKARSLCVLVMKLPKGGLGVTVVNFGREDVEEELDVREAAKKAHVSVDGAEAIDMLSGGGVGAIGKEGRLKVRVPGLGGTTYLLKAR